MLSAESVSAELTPEQRALRIGRIGASQIACIAGLLSSRPPIVAYQEILGIAPPSEDDDFTMLGKLLEGGLAEFYAWKTGATLKQPGTLVHPTIPWACASPDRLVIGIDGTPLRCLEIKTANRFMASEWGAEQDEIPEAYICQGAWQMMVTDLPECDLFALVGGVPCTYPLKRDPELERDLLSLATQFMEQHVAKGMPPPVDGTRQYDGYLRRSFPKSGGYMRAPDDQCRRIYEDLRRARSERKKWEEMEDECSNQIKALIADADGIEGIATWKANKKGTRTFKLKEDRNGNG